MEIKTVEKFKYDQSPLGVLIYEQQTARIRLIETKMDLSDDIMDLEYALESGLTIDEGKLSSLRSNRCLVDDRISMIEQFIHKLEIIQAGDRQRQSEGVQHLKEVEASVIYQIKKSEMNIKKEIKQLIEMQNESKEWCQIF